MKLISRCVKTPMATIGRIIHGVDDAGIAHAVDHDIDGGKTTGHENVRGEHIKTQSPGYRNRIREALTPVDAPGVYHAIYRRGRCIACSSETAILDPGAVNYAVVVDGNGLVHVRG